ncbi:hypothetical protein MCUN1_001727 [Malassezia cuniculi]|uniref:Uncharacterized protein n=1 Tax=Malassezia cuniculi TaxID=948313 RepID=A0AAF0EYD4_9BASI|nr:hypothetical protein MCUN1_001727 [Malassezia cuniculi]
MDPLLQPPLRVQTERNPKSLSTQEAQEAVENFIADYKNRTSGEGASSEDAAGGVLLSQLSRLRDGLKDA